MNWVYFAVAVGLVGFLTEMALRYRRESTLARTRQKAVQSVIAKTGRRIEKIQAKIDAAQSNMNSLKEEKETLKGDVKEARGTLEKMEEKEKRRRPGRLAVDRDQADQ